MLNSHINCKKCKYFFVTWDSGIPYGCNRHGFKSKSIPSMVVKRESGENCLAFEEKKLPGKNKSYGHNDNKYW